MIPSSPCGSLGTLVGVAVSVIEAGPGSVVPVVEIDAERLMIPAVDPLTGDEVEGLRVSGRLELTGAGVASPQLLTDFYEQRRFEPAWRIRSQAE